MARDLDEEIEVYVRHCFRECTSPRVDELARLLELHPSVLSRKFRLRTTRRLSQVLKERQIEEAKSLLRTTDEDMRSIARHAGFGTINTLFRLFRKFVGVTPQQYRRTR